MRLFKNMFRNGSNESAVAVEAMRMKDEPGPAFRPRNEELFIDTTAPIAADQHLPPATLLKRLTARDNTELGRQVGFQHHDLEMSRLKQEQIKAEIIQALDDQIERLEVLIGTFDVEIGRLEGSPLQLRAQLTRDRYARDQVRLNEQMMQVLGNSGIVEFALTTFQVGFNEGHAQYLASVELLAKYQG